MGRVPTTMRVLVLHSYEEGWKSLTLEEKPVPIPGPGEVVVRVAATPVNPSDLTFMQGLYAFKKPLPVTPGIEASGTVVAAGKGFLARRLLGKRVACAANDHGDGTWAQFVATKATNCIPLPSGVSDEQGAMALVNPLTVLALLDLAMKHKSRAIINTGAASALGRMLVVQARRQAIEVINIVRREEQVQILRSIGASHILSSSSSDFERRLEQLSSALEVKIAFDAVGGDMTAILLAALPKNGKVTVYGFLSSSETLINDRHLIFESKAVDGFYLPHWLGQRSFYSLFRLGRRVTRDLRDGMRTQVRQMVPLAEYDRAIQGYLEEMTAGKFLFTPND
ncbi:MAG: zinc-binding dehydrogenase [Chloroflexi bacterium]|nr:zinc-binding dehydrogenase [Chloroflexota bacterium]